MTRMTDKEKEEICKKYPLMCKMLNKVAKQENNKKKLLAERYEKLAELENDFLNSRRYKKQTKIKDILKRVI